MDYLQFIHAELLVLIPVLYLIGIALKASPFKDHYIPLALGAISIFLCALWVFTNSVVSTAPQVAMATFSAITQGVLTAGASVYANQICKQLKNNL